MNKVGYFNILILLFCMFLLACENKVDKILFPENMEAITLDPSKTKPCITCDIKIVGYLGMTQYRSFSFLKLTSNNLNKYQDSIPVILIFGNENKEEGITKDYLINYLKEVNLPYSVFYDKDDTFFKMNHLQYYPYDLNDIQFYLVKGEKVEMELDIGVPNLLEKQIEEFLSE